jgi:endonuclease-8
VPERAHHPTGSPADLDALADRPRVRALQPAGPLRRRRRAARRQLRSRHRCVRQTPVRPYGRHASGRRWLHVHLGLYGRFEITSRPAAPARGAVRSAWSRHALRRPARPDGWRAVQPGREGRGARPGGARPPAPGRAAGRRVRPDRQEPDADRRVADGPGRRGRHRERLPRRDPVPVRHLAVPRGQPAGPAEWDVLWADLRRLMRAGVRAGHILTRGPSTARAAAVACSSRTGSTLPAYRAALPSLRTPVQTQEMATRNLYWCPVCQSA